MSIMSEEQKIIDLENEISFLKDRLYEEQEQNEYLRDKVDNQQKEIEEKNIAVNKMSKDISRQLEEIEEKSTIIMAGAEKVKQLEKDNDTLSELVIVNEDKVIKELDLISKDKIRDILKDLDEFDTTFFNANSLKEAIKNSLNRLLEEN